MNVITRARQVVAAHRADTDQRIKDQTTSDLVVGKVTSVQSGSVSTVTVTYGADATPISGVAHDDAYSPTAGDYVTINLDSRGSPYVTGKRA